MCIRDRSVAFVVYKLCDKNRLSTFYIEEFLNKIQAVSYTQLDVYKRQLSRCSLEYCP